jgi:CubicO group peptidase (beta-lactamase class C family)
MLPWKRRGNFESNSPQRTHTHRVARPSVEALDMRLLMAAAPVLGIAGIKSRVTAAVQSLLATNVTPGMAVAITDRGRVVFARGYGSANLATGAPVTARTGFNLASVTKTFTAEAVLLLYQDPSLIKKQGIRSLKLDVPISTYLSNEIDPSGIDFVLPSQWNKVTVRELLNMSSGIPVDPANAGGGNSGVPWYVYVDEMNPTLRFQPGTKYLYSNVNFWLLGELIEQLSGETYERFVTRELLQPLGMKNTTFLVNDTVAGEATGYTFNSSTNQWSALAPGRYSTGQWNFSAGEIVSTAADMGIYISTLSARKLLKPATYALMWQRTPLRPYEGTGTAVPGLGWDDADSIEDTSQGRVVSKDGGVPGYRSRVSLFLDQRVGITVLLNAEISESALQDSIHAIDLAVSDRAGKSVRT